VRQPGGLEATVTSKGQITLPRLLRESLGLKRGSRIRFRIEADGGLRGDPVLFELEDLWAMADRGRRPKHPMTPERMESAKARRRW
jgi:AbrB family looped-hinge helix DNA binding protein